jgi:hypothetical protein|tara:strand:- start:1486 stop:1683 length:198 start_codon:yes stop_codon:yes gene_type:complete
LAVDLKSEVVRLLSATEIPFRVIAKKCGVSERYLYRYATGEYLDPGYAKTSRIYEYLSGRTVKVA